MFYELTNSQELEELLTFEAFVENASLRGEDMEINGLLKDEIDFESTDVEGAVSFHEFDREFTKHLNKYEAEGFDVAPAIKAWHEGYNHSLMQV